MKKFIQNVLIFSLVFFVIDKLFYPLLYLSPSLEVDNRLEKVINGELNKDIIVFGSSQGARNIIARQIEDSLNISTYNLSYPGSDIEFHNFLLKSLIKFNKTPKMVLLVVDDKTELLPSNILKFRYDRLYPLSINNYINNEMIKRGQKNFISNFLVLSRINRSNFDIREKKFNPLDTIQYCGSMPISFQRKNYEWNFIDSISYNQEQELPEKVDAFLSFHKLCSDNNIKLVLIFPPNIKTLNPYFEKRMRELSNKKTSFFKYDTSKSMYKEKSYYYDNWHLQRHGAAIFTEEIIEKLTEISLK